ncbi:MAG: hypothetical protein ACJAQ7_001169 [Sediminicola sp.]|jgi:hypothetical protein
MVSKIFQPLKHFEFEQINIVAAMHGEATFLVLKEDKYQKNTVNQILICNYWKY